MAGKINTGKTFSGCPYSVLVYGLLAGLQALHSARLTGKRGGTGLAPGFRVWGFRTLGAGGFQVLGFRGTEFRRSKGLGFEA